MNNKPGAPKQNKNAQKGDMAATSRIVFRCTDQQKEQFISSARLEGLKLTEWILKRLTPQ